MQMAIRIAFRELQGDVPDGERYSLSQGRVRQHSVPPRTMLSELPLGSLSSSSLTEDPVSASIADLKRSPHQRRWVLAGIGLGVFVVMALVFSGGSKSGTSTTDAQNAAAALPPATIVTEKLTAEVPPEKAQPGTADTAEAHGVDSSGQGQVSDAPRASRPRRYKPGAGASGTPSPASGENKPPSAGKTGAGHDAPFDPFSRRD
jgi:hypothetical protein